MDEVIHVVGGGLAGSEAAFQLAERGHRVVLHEMRPLRGTEAHKTDRLAELVCSNTFKSTEVTNAHGLLKAEMRVLGSLILEGADVARVPAGSALAVDREVFSAFVHERVMGHANIRVERGEVTALPPVGIVATGPLTSDALAAAIRDRLGLASLAFYDAIAPIVAVESIDEGIAFRAARWDKETMAQEETEPGAYLNCAMDRDAYEAFIDALTAADQFTAHEFDAVPYFEGCMPIEEMARRGRESLRHGPMRPVGLRDPRTGKRPWAVVQLRRPDEREEPRRVDLVHQPVLDDHDVVAERLVHVRHAARDAGHGPQHLGVGRSVLADRRREAGADRRHDRRAAVVLVVEFRFHPLRRPRRHRDRREEPERERVAAGRAHQCARRQHPKLPTNPGHAKPLRA